MEDHRFDTALYTISEAARILAVPTSTLTSWSRGYRRRFKDRPDVVGEAIITSLPAATNRQPSIPFVGLAEGLVLAALRRSNLPMQRIRPALAALEDEIGLDHALASEQLYTDGAEVLYDFGESHRESPEGQAIRDLVVVRNGQRVYAEVVDAYLKRIEYGIDGYASLIHVPAYPNANVVVDPQRSFGAPRFVRGGAKVEDVLHRFWAGESLAMLVGEFGVPKAEIEDVLRATSRRAA